MVSVASAELTPDNATELGETQHPCAQTLREPITVSTISEKGVPGQCTMADFEVKKG